MGTGLKRGFVLRIYKAMIKKAMSGEDGWAEDITGEKLIGADAHPTLVVQLAAGSPWRHELHLNRLHIRELLNARLESDFVKEVRFH